MLIKKHQLNFVSRCVVSYNEHINIVYVIKYLLYVIPFIFIGYFFIIKLNDTTNLVIDNCQSMNEFIIKENFVFLTK